MLANRWALEEVVLGRFADWQYTHRKEPTAVPLDAEAVAVGVESAAVVVEGARPVAGGRREGSDWLAAAVVGAGDWVSPSHSADCWQLHPSCHLLQRVSTRVAVWTPPALKCLASHDCTHRSGDSAEQESWTFQ